MTVGERLYCHAVTTVLTGLEVLCRDVALLASRRFALLTNQAAVTSRLQPAWQALADCGGDLVKLFAPEHGLFGVAQDMESVGDEVFSPGGVPARSLYGASAATLAPQPDELAGLDAVVVDLPDIGCRYYTFAATMAHVMAVCAPLGVEVIVCDRPNPLGGVVLEGGLVQPACRSFVSELPVPVRHGLTLGELALLLREERYGDLSLTVVPCQGWRRQAWWDETGLPWVAPSPNMPTLITAAVYPGACLVEATNLSEGRGTTRPFQLIGAPWLEGEELSRRLNGRGLPGCGFRACRFRPEFGKWAGEVCGGVEWHVLDRTAMCPLTTGIILLKEVRALAPERFAWRREAYEFVAEVPAIDLLTGSPEARAVIEGCGDEVGLFAAWEESCRAFAVRRRACLLYPEEG